MIWSFTRHETGSWLYVISFHIDGWLDDEWCLYYVLVCNKGRIVLHYIDYSVDYHKRRNNSRTAQSAAYLFHSYEVWMLCMTHWIWYFVGRESSVVMPLCAGISMHSLIYWKCTHSPNEKGINYIIISLINMFGFVSIVSNEKSQFYSFHSFVHSFVYSFVLSFASFQINLISLCISYGWHAHKTQTYWMCAQISLGAECLIVCLRASKPVLHA